MNKVGGLKDDITPTAIFKEIEAEYVPYVTYQKEFERAYIQLLSNVGFSKDDWDLKTPKVMRCATLFQKISEISEMTKNEQFVNEVRPVFDAAIVVENDFYQQMKKKLQIIQDFYDQTFLTEIKELGELAPIMEGFQKNRPTDPEKIQEMDKTVSRFTELQRSLKKRVEPGVEAIQASHLKAIRDVMVLFEKQHEQLAIAMAPFEKLTSYTKVPRETENQKKVAEDD